jgi:hypothetical protein
MIAETTRLFVGSLVIMLCCFFVSCEKAVSPTMHSSARIQIDLSKVGSNKYREQSANDIFPQKTDGDCQGRSWKFELLRNMEFYNRLEIAG